MQIIHGDRQLRAALESDPALVVNDADEFEQRYDELNLAFHAHFQDGVREHGVENAAFHKWRYCSLVREPLKGIVIDVGNDKPFLSFYMHALHPDADIKTISFEIPQSPYDLYAVDIESEKFPFTAESADVVLFAEVLEHLWRDPSHAIYEINRVLRRDGVMYLTTPNPCELHAITCILWQANPNQRSQIFRTLESGHVHLWSSPDLRLLIEGNGFAIDEMTSFDPYRYTQKHDDIVKFVTSISPYPDLMGECLLVRARKIQSIDRPAYPKEIFPDGVGVQFEGAMRAFALNTLMRSS